MAFDSPASPAPAFLRPFEPVHDSCVYVSRDQRFVPLKLWQAQRDELSARQRRIADRVTAEAYAELMAGRGTRALG